VRKGTLGILKVRVSDILSGVRQLALEDRLVLAVFIAVCFCVVNFGCNFVKGGGKLASYSTQVLHWSGTGL